MTRIHFRIARFEGNVGLEAIVIVLGVLCAGVLLSSFVGALNTALQRGEALRESQRAGVASTPTRTTASLANAVTPLRQVAVVAE